MVGPGLPCTRTPLRSMCTHLNFTEFLSTRRVAGVCGLCREKLLCERVSEARRFLLFSVTATPILPPLPSRHLVVGVVWVVGLPAQPVLPLRIPQLRT